MKELASRKRLLVVESDLNRQTLKLHCSNVGDAIARAGRLIQTGRAASPLLLAAIATSAFLVVRKRKSFSGWLGRAISGWQLLRTLKPVWDAWAERRASKSARATGARDGTAAQPTNAHE